jgi:hypothetical protein
MTKPRLRSRRFETDSTPDAPLATAAETLGTRRVFTIDRNDFETYRVRRGHRHHAIQIVS